MSFLSGVFGKPQAQPQQQVQQPQGQPQNQQPGNNAVQQNTAQGQQGNQNQGGGSTASGQRDGPQNSTFQGGEANPLDNWLRTLQGDPKNQQQQQQPQNESLFGNSDPNQIREMVSKANFVNGIDPAKMQAALGGDQQAFMDVLNGVAQNAFMHSFQASQGLVEHGVKTGNERFSGSLDSRMKQFLLSQQNSSHPALQHPLGKAFLDSAKQQIARANPSFTTEEIASKAEAMFVDFAKQLSPSQPQQGQNGDNRNANQVSDWSAFLGESNSGS